ncbi:hypothetical protein ACHAP5_012004 [Fusarium lateritium]
MIVESGTYGIKGLPRPADAITRTHTHENSIPYVEKLPVRYEISVLASSTDPDLRRQWTLFVLALERFKLKPVSEKLSYFQVAGIHGYPENTWDGAPEPRADPENPKAGDQPFGGYCNHNGLNFPTWHRPYMALFEQCVWDNMNDVIEHWVNKHHLEDPELGLWKTAKDTWRMPYWDWARQQSYNEDFAYPQILIQGPVRIYVPDAVKDYYPPSGLYANPFWSYENPEKDNHGNPLPFGLMPKGKGDYNIRDNPVKHDAGPPSEKGDQAWLPWSLATGTSRYGIFVNKTAKRFMGLQGVNNAWVANNHLANMTWYPINKNQEAQEQNEDDEDEEQDEVHKEPYFKWNPGTLADSVNRMFCPHYNDTWGKFASTKWTKESHEGSKTGFLSLEYIHNNVHNIVGGSDYKTGIGHMSDVPVAAFDPIFWLHHTQIDRLLAIWQSLYPSLWWDKNEPGEGNVRDDQPDDPLFPFHDKKDGDPVKDVWTSNKCRDWTVFNYQYDDLQTLSEKALDNEGALDESKFQDLLQAYIQKTYPTTQHLLCDIKKAPIVKIPDGLRPKPGSNSWYDYIINIKYDRYALNGTAYTIKFYLGGPKGKKITHYEPQNYVGSVYTFGGGSRESQDSCSNCKKQADKNTLSCAQVPLTLQLLHHTIDGLRDHPLETFDQVEKYLELHLRWKVYGFGGVEVAKKDYEQLSKTEITVLRGIGQPQHVAAPLKRDALEGFALSSFSLMANEAPISDSNIKNPVAVPPTYENDSYKPLASITHGKPFGLQQNGGYRA